MEIRVDCVCLTDAIITIANNVSVSRLLQKIVISTCALHSACLEEGDCNPTPASRNTKTGQYWPLGHGHQRQMTPHSLHQEAGCDDDSLNCQSF